MEQSLAKSDYCLLLWSQAAAKAAWVQLEWEAALCRTVKEARAFLVVGRLEEHPLPALLAPRLYIDLFPGIHPGIDRLIQEWRSDRAVENETARPVENVTPFGHETETTFLLYVTSAFFGVTIPIEADLDTPVGILLQQVIETLDLPTVFSHSGRLGLRFDYRFVCADKPLANTLTPRLQGLQARDVLWLEFDMVPFSIKPPRAGQLHAATFRRGHRSVDKSTAEVRQAARSFLLEKIAKSGL